MLQVVAHQMAALNPGQTLQATALVHELWIRWSVRDRQSWVSRDQFLAAAARAMREILIDRARRKNRLKRGGQLTRVNLDDVDVAATDDSELLLRLDEALSRMAKDHPEKARMVELRYFCGLDLTEVAAALGISVATVKRQWVFCRAWLYRELSSSL